MGNLRKRFFKRFSVLFVVFMFFAIFALDAHAESGILKEIKELIKNHYVNYVPEEALSANSVDGVIRALNDPYTEYFSKEEYKEFYNTLNMKLCGIGISIEAVSDGIKVVSLMKGQPAEKAGIVEGDIIVKADGLSLKSMTSTEATSYIKGEEGTTVQLEVKRGNKLLKFSVMRKLIEVPTVTAKVIGGNVGYINIASFGENTKSEFKSNLKMIKSKGVNSYVIDLRNNGGGYMDAAVNVAEYFIGQRVSLVTQNKYGGKNYYNELDNGIEIDKPVIFLINEFSASASEILSAAVKDYNKAFFIGNTTYGKGVAQSLIDLSNGGVLKLTTMKFYSPKGNIIQKIGIAPNLKTGTADPLLTAQLLLGKSKEGYDKRGFIKVSIENRSYEIDMNMAQKNEYMASLRCILDYPLTLAYMGTANGWKKLERNADEYWKLYYMNNIMFNKISNAPVDKKFTVTFSKDIDGTTINSKTIELVRASTGERVSVKFDFINGNQVRVTPEKPLNPGEKYYLVIDKSIKGRIGENMARGTVTTVEVEKAVSINTVNTRILSHFKLIK